MMNKTIPIIPFYKKLHKYEISCVLFDVCNLKCKFCFETNKSRKINFDYIKSIPQILFDNYEKAVKQDNLDIDFVSVMLWGGEVFFDGLPDSIFDVYRQLIDDITNYFTINHPNVEVQFSWLSNGVFTKVDRVINLLTSYNNHIIGFSYDPIDRFSNDKQRQLMIENTKRFVDLGLCERVSITLTKPNIEAWLNDHSDLQMFKDIGVTIDVNYYIANPNYQLMLPNDQLIYQFFKMLIDNQIFNVIVLEKMLWYHSNAFVDKFCDCHQCSQITNGVWSIDCASRSSSLPKERFYGFYSDVINEQTTNPVKASLGLLKRGCLTCSYHNRCQMPCWISIIFDQYQCTKCPYQAIYEYIDQYPEVIKQYEQFHSRNFIINHS